MYKRQLHIHHPLISFTLSFISFSFMVVRNNTLHIHIHIIILTSCRRRSCFLSPQSHLHMLTHARYARLHTPASHSQTLSASASSSNTTWPYTHTGTHAHMHTDTQAHRHTCITAAPSHRITHHNLTQAFSHNTCAFLGTHSHTSSQQHEPRHRITHRHILHGRHRHRHPGTQLHT